MRFHVAALPGQKAHSENSHCAYSTKTQRFCSMMTDLGHEVFLYCQGESDARTTETVSCFREFDEPWVDWNVNDPRWVEANGFALYEIAQRREPDDFLCLIAGWCQEPLTKVALVAVEWGIGYTGVFCSFRVFESYAWMHTVYGGSDNPYDVNGRNYDSVIPNFFDVDQFPEGDGGDDLLYVGRNIQRKGVDAAVEVARTTGRHLTLAGNDDYKPGAGEANIDYIGSVGPDERAELMGAARVLLAPTDYVEPFGGVAVEAQLCGTPVLTTDWGAFTETVRHGVDGFRCRTLGEFVKGVELAESLDRSEIRSHAQATYSMEAVGPAYEAYFEQVADLRGQGWYSLETHESFPTRYGTQRRETDEEGGEGRSKGPDQGDSPSSPRDRRREGSRRDEGVATAVE